MLRSFLCFFTCVAALNCVFSALAEAPSVHDLVARRFVIGFSGYTLPDKVAQYMQEAPPAGVILFDRNIQSPEQLKALTAQIRSVSKKPLIIMIDQEGGRVARLRQATGFGSPTPSAAVLSNEPVSQSYAAGYSIGLLLKNMGIDMDLAPVVDLGIEGGYIKSRERTLGRTVGAVVERARAFTKGLHAHRICNCLKHFPGHGSGRPDPHENWTNVTDVYQSIEIEPFRQLIAEGQADSVMVGHLFNIAWDVALPASLSPYVVQKLLRQDLGFKGLVMGDDLHMAASGMKPGEAAYQSLVAGVDLFLDTGTGHLDHPSPEWTYSMLREHLDALIPLVEANLDLQKNLQAAEERLNYYFRMHTTSI